MKKIAILISALTIGIISMAFSLNTKEILNERNTIKNLVKNCQANAECEISDYTGGCEFKCDDTENETCTFEVGPIKLTCSGKEVDC